jgi:HD superfamily phosphohydrolase YqeK
MNKKIQEKIIKDIGESRFKHSLRVRDTAIKLAKKKQYRYYKSRISSSFS